MNTIDICNLALSYIGKGTIADLEEKNENARQCKLHYDHQRQMLLRDYDWGFARRIVNLAVVNAKIPGWRYVYKYPAKCLAVRRLFPQHDCNLTRFPNEFNETLARALASALAIALTGSAQVQQTQYQLMQLALNKAHVSEAKEQEWEQKYPEKYIKARW